MYDRRQLLKLGGAALAGSLAGCSAPSSDDAGTTVATTTTSTATETQTTTSGTRSFDFGGWLENTSNYDGTVTDARGESTVSVAVGAEGNGGSFAFDPPAVQVDPGTTVRWEWTGSGGSHNVVANSGADFRSGAPTDSGDATFEHTFDEEGIVTYFCSPHESLGMKGAIVVGDPESGTADQQSEYGWIASAFDAYWYSLYNMSTNIAMNGNGITFPTNDQQRQQFRKRQQAIAANADAERPPINNPNLNMAPFTAGDPHFTEQPVFKDDTGRPDASTLTWDRSQSSGVVSPAALAWTHLKGVTWAKNFEKHFERLPETVAPKFRAQILATMAQLGVKFALVDGNLRKNDQNMLLASEFTPGQGITDATPQLRHHSAMLWFLSDLTSLAQNDWFGYVNPKPLIPAQNIQKLTDGMGKTVMNAFPADSLSGSANTRQLAELLGALGWYGTHAGSDQLASAAADYTAQIAGLVTDAVDGNGRVSGGSRNLAATQGLVAQGLVWASQIDGVDRTDAADDVAGYLLEELWDEAAGTFASGTDAGTYTITARDAGDITGGLNAAEAELGRSEVQKVFPQFIAGTFHQGKLQRAQRPPSVSESTPNEPPLPPKAGGEFGQAAVYNTEVQYDTGSGEWSVTDDRFRTAQALYLANQDVWIGNWGGDFYQGRGVPGKSDEPPN